ncbi:hypothetical protein E2C01_016567 [Portunus trituberculatus]|uniref:Uncharacterized protein n=1 Tax=Portunus trituberculatus TaxID=210409 RepID=A0A5B7DRG3_PORTR|nr:hypothetical protein [Portunus trituberculatus]
MWWDSNLCVDICLIPCSSPYPLHHHLPGCCHNAFNANTL